MPAPDGVVPAPDGAVPAPDSAPPAPDSAPPQPDGAPPTGCSCPSPPQVSGPSTVVGDGTAGSCTEGALKNAVFGGGTVTFDCGPADVTIPINAKITVTKPTLVDGGGKVTLDGQGKTQILVNKSTLTVKGLTFTRGWLAYKWNGAPGGGGAINSNWSKELNVFDCTFTENRVDLDGFGGAIFQASMGGAIATEGKQPATIKGCTFGGNSSDVQGGNTTEVGNTYQ